MLTGICKRSTRVLFVLALLTIGFGFLYTGSTSAQPSCTSAARVEAMRYDDEKRDVTLKCWLQAVAEGERKLSGAYLRGADLKSKDLNLVDLSNSDLSGADLTNANLSGAKLIKANLNQAILADIDLTNADLTGATLNEANLAGAKLNRAVLTDAKLIKADLRDAELNQAKLGGRLKLTGAKVSKGTSGLGQGDLDRYQ